MKKVIELPTEIFTEISRVGLKRVSDNDIDVIDKALQMARPYNDEELENINDDIPHYTDKAEELLKLAPLITIAEYMDDDIRKHLHSVLFNVSAEDFLALYIAEHYKKYGEWFTI